MEPRKTVGRRVALALGLVCVLLIAGLGMAAAYYTVTINNRDNEVNTLNSKISGMNATLNQLNTTIGEQNKTIAELNSTIDSLSAELQMARDGDISAQTAYRMVNSGVLVVDVRTPSEYDIMHINNSVNIPYYNMTDFATRLSPLAGKQNTQMILYCRTGVRSKNAWLYLNSTGYTEIYNMLGGINAWRALNYTVWEAPSEAISLTEAWWMVEAGQGVKGTFPNMVIVDVRDAASYAIGHLPNATDMPYVNDFQFKSEITSVLSGKENSEIVVYCNGDGCELASMASSVLIENGFTKVYWIPDGYGGWVAAGYPIDTGSVP
jgi:rhodanese-related sulfurtransferase